MIILNIIFPTHNRANYLRRAVRSVALQMAILPTDIKVDLTIYDNASTDSTPEICAELIKEFPLIKLIRHSTNIGGDPNIHQALRSSTGDYVWVFGDDDYVREGALKFVCEALCDHRPAFLRMQGLEERYLEGMPLAPAVIPDSLFAEPVKKCYSSHDEILSAYGLGLGNFTKTIFSREFIRKYYREVNPVLFASGYSQLAWIYEGLRTDFADLLELDEQIVVIRIELSPRGLDSSRVRAGLSILRNYLIENDYSLRLVDRLIKDQNNAIVLGEIKTRKMTGWKQGTGILGQLWKLNGPKAKVKCIGFYLLPAAIMKKMWLARKS